MTYAIDVMFALLAYFSHTKTQTINSATVAFDFIASSLVISVVSMSSIWLELGPYFFIVYAAKEVFICNIVQNNSVKWAYCISAVIHVAVCIDVEFIGSMITYDNYSGVMLMICFAKILSSSESLGVQLSPLRGVRS